MYSMSRGGCTMKLIKWSFGSLTFQGTDNIHLIICSIKLIKIEYLCIYIFPYKVFWNCVSFKLYKTQFWIHKYCISNSIKISFYFQFQRKHDLIHITKWSLDPLSILLVMFQKIVNANKYHDILKNKEFNSIQELLTVVLEFLAPSLDAILCSNAFLWWVHPKHLSRVGS